MTALTQIPEAEAFILHWGEMGSQWGVNRSVAQIHALLYLSDRPLHAEESASGARSTRPSRCSASSPRRSRAARTCPRTFASGSAACTSSTAR